MNRFLIMGYGYTAKFLKLQLEKDGHEVLSTSRQGAPHIAFDLLDPSTWENLPEKVDGTFLCFAAEPPDKIATLLDVLSPHLGRIVTIGTTGSFLTENPHDWVDETTPQDQNSPRVQGENLIRKNGGIVVSSAGIYGPGRNPMSWVEKGLVGPSEKYLNLIYVTDLVKILCAAMKTGEDGHLYLAADGKPFRWNEIISRWQIEYELAVHPNARPSQRISKRICADFSLERLGVTLEFSDIFSGFRQIHS